MARAAGHKFISGLRVLCLLLGCARAAGGDAHSVFYNFTITMNGNQRCEVRGQVHGKTFLQYTCSQRAKSDCYRLSMTRKEKEACKEEFEILKYLTEEFPKLLDDMTYPHTLKGEMTCQREGNGHAYGSWDFYINGSKALHFDSKNGNRTVLSHEGAQLKNSLKNHKYMIDFLLNKSPEMCESWPENTTDPVTSKRTTEPLTRSPATNLSKMKISISVIVPVIVIGLVIFGFYRYRKWRCRQRARKKPPSGDCVGQDEEASILRTPEIPGELSGSQSPDSQLPADWRQRSTEGLCLEQRPATHPGSPVSCVCPSDSDFALAALDDPLFIYRPSTHQDNTVDATSRVLCCIC